jgi:hypothetical protein
MEYIVSKICDTYQGEEGRVHVIVEFEVEDLLLLGRADLKVAVVVGHRQVVEDLQETPEQVDAVQLVSVGDARGEKLHELSLCYVFEAILL